MPRITALALVLLGLSGCATASFRDPTVTISSAAAFDPVRYTGLWYEIARFPVPYQNGCVGVTAAYDQQADGTLAVVNTCRAGHFDGSERQVRGTAQLVGPGRLSINFESVPFVQAPYWVLWVDDSYETAVVGVPSGRAGWILSREPGIRPDRLTAAREVLAFNGYDLAQLKMTPQPPASPTR